MNDSEVSSRMEKVECPLCGGNEFKTLLRARDWYFGAPGEYTVCRCKACSLVMQNPRLSAREIAEFYPDDYEPHVLAASPGEQEALIDAQEPRRRILEKFVPGGRNLDVGSGDGRFLLCLKRAGWEVAGCEFVDRVAAYQRDKLGLDVISGDLLSAGLPDAHFDSVTLWSVLEHLHQPVETMNEIKRLLKPGGVVVIGVPNFHSLERALFKKYWFALQTPYHLFFYTPSTMNKLLSKTGFVLEETIFATTATCVLNSLKMVMGKYEKPGHVVPAASESESNTADFEGNDKGMKQLVFDYGLAPVLKLLDRLHVGGHTIYLARRRN